MLFIAHRRSRGRRKAFFIHLTTTNSAGGVLFRATQSSSQYLNSCSEHETRHKDERHVFQNHVDEGRLPSPPWILQAALSPLRTQCVASSMSVYSFANKNFAVSTISPAILAWVFPGAAWFHHQLIPSSEPVPDISSLDGRTKMAIWQLGNCMFQTLTL